MMVCERSHPTQSRPDVPIRRRVARVGLPACAAGAVLAMGLARHLTRVVVSGTSMQPGFLPGDRLVVVPARRLHPGQVVAVRDPREPSRILVKRIRSIRDGLVDVRGDDDAASTDSRHFGPVPRTSVIGKVVYRYAPPTRAGRLLG
jgi:nickel-type superoxide dismutase maturation protease